MNYNINDVAKEMMIESEDLREILEMFILEAGKILAQCEEEYVAANADSLAKHFHALKGSALNLRINSIGNLAAQLEIESKVGNITNVEVILPQIKEEVLYLQDLL